MHAAGTKKSLLASWQDTGTRLGVASQLVFDTVKMIEKLPTHPGTACGPIRKVNLHMLHRRLWWKTTKERE